MMVTMQDIVYFLSFFGIRVMMKCKSVQDILGERPEENT
jgi:hypothetical protein